MTVTYKTAILAEELGYNRAFCDYVYTPNGEKRRQLGVRNYPKEMFPSCYSAPTHEQLLQWIRKNYKLSIEVTWDGLVGRDHKWCCTYTRMEKNLMFYRENTYGDNYERTMDEGLFNTLEYIKNNQTTVKIYLP